MKDRIICYCDYISEYCLYLLIFCLPFAKAGIQIFICAAALFWLIKKVLDFNMPIKNPLPSTELNKPLLAFIIVCALSTILSADFSLSLRALFSKVIKNTILFFIVVETINNKRRLKNALIVIIASAGLMVIDTVVQYFRGIDFLRNNVPLGYRLQASFSSPNGFGGWLIVIMPILAGIILSKQFMCGITKKIILALLFTLSLICLAMTYSRASWLGFILSFTFIIYYFSSLLNIRTKILGSFVNNLIILGIKVRNVYRNLLVYCRLSYERLSSSKPILDKSVRNIILPFLIICQRVTEKVSSYLRMTQILSIFILLLPIALFLIMPDSAKIKIKSIIPAVLKQTIKYDGFFQKTRERFISILQLEDSGLVRINLWKESLGIIEDFPLFGIGLNTYSKIAPKYAKAGGGYYPHNSYLQMAAEIGILGLFAFLWIIIKLFGIGMHALKDTNDNILLGFLAAFLAFLTQSFFDVNFYALQLAVLFWLALGLAVARIKIADNP